MPSLAAWIALPCHFFETMYQTQGDRKALIHCQDCSVPSNVLVTVAHEWHIDWTLQDFSEVFCTSLNRNLWEALEKKLFLIYLQIRNLQENAKQSHNWKYTTSCDKGNTPRELAVAPIGLQLIAHLNSSLIIKDANYSYLLCGVQLLWDH